MSPAQNKAIVRRFIEELWNNRNLTVADEIFAADCVTHQLTSGSLVATASRDPETVKKHVVEWLNGFPDLQFHIEQSFAEDDRVLSQLLMQGTHLGTWQGIAPTNKQVNIRMFAVHRLVDGRIVEDWVLVESLGFFQQLGLVPATEELISKAAE